MKQNLAWTVMLFFVAQNAGAIKLNEQIKQNVDNATKSYEQLVNKEPARLWIHVRNEQQKQLLQNLASWFKPLSLIKIEPIQLVKEGPKKTQLRFFSKQDEAQAGSLLKRLQKIFPHLELQDLSSKFDGTAWLRSGYFELWLGADVKKISPPEPSSEGGI